MYFKICDAQFYPSGGKVKTLGSSKWQLQPKPSFSTFLLEFIQRCGPCTEKIISCVKGLFEVPLFPQGP